MNWHLFNRLNGLHAAQSRETLDLRDTIRFPKLPDTPKLGHSFSHKPALNLADYVASQAEPPAAVHRSNLYYDWGMLANDRLGSCGEAMAMHAIEAFHLDAQTPAPKFTDAEAVKLYEEVAGYDPNQTQPDGSNPTDQGTDNNVLVGKWQGPGVADAAGNRHTIAGSVFVDPANEVLSRIAIWEFVVLFRAINLPASAQGQHYWRVTDPSLQGDAAPGTWGGHDVCMAGETEIPLLTGESLTIAEMAERGGDRWLYASTTDGRIVPALGRRPRLTGRARDVVRVVLDDGSSFRCTPDHRIMRRDGSWAGAATLRAGDSLMPLYRRISEKSATGMGGYEQVKHPKTGRWQFTHRLVASAVSGGYPPGMVVHHDNFDKLNNEPENLILMSWEAHRALHAELANPERLRAYARSEEGRTNSRAMMAALWADPAWRARSLARLAAHSRSTEHRRRVADLGRRERSAAERAALADLGRLRVARLHTPEARAKTSATLRRRFETDPGYRAALTERMLAAQSASTEMPITEAQRRARSENAKRLNARRWGTNHKVVSVQLAGQADVYDMTVDGLHNFAVGPGVFVHNCALSYDANRLRLVTWGTELLMDWSFDAAYALEGFVVVTEEMLNLRGFSPSGLNWTRLNADLTSLRNQTANVVSQP